MFNVERIANNRLNISYEGKLNSDEMETALNDFMREAEGIENGKMLFEIGEFNFPTLSAVGVKLSKLPSLFKFIGKFNRAAILTDKKWLQNISELEGMLIPGLEIKAFSLSDRSAAEAWLA
ncbi:SpoIIAA-like protein [Alteromonadaceae bacterium 2753L.S.0a.02]|nr:SpoIIAA-like protein [Alteromonadaceae bacterium 2753L.S.0a.02]